MNALRELFSIARVVGAWRGKRERLATFHERFETHEVDRLFKALAQLHLDARLEIGGLIRVAPKRRTEE